MAFVTALPAFFARARVALTRFVARFSARFTVRLAARFTERFAETFRAPFLAVVRRGLDRLAALREDLRCVAMGAAPEGWGKGGVNQKDPQRRPLEQGTSRTAGITSPPQACPAPASARYIRPLGRTRR